ncbi:hypothetical protein CAPTEDRAFT_155483 [Capitella teleta]|uniref:Solute carrier family 12 member 9 n=1 Tax=Capitella teleta TaxID=283909 RepID=R7UEF3_CAPTE|nr:hypothetical protein CAPTEDRAFT_155483 [Capitella teleta]|eukprot:ELU01652.1 hypothetical protein CAPTEDRAFT_155483 [Capitella teleta]
MADSDRTPLLEAETSVQIRGPLGTPSPDPSGYGDNQGPGSTWSTNNCSEYARGAEEANIQWAWGLEGERTDETPGTAPGDVSGVGPQRTLRTFNGVFSPVALSMFSTVLFLREGFVVGQSGFLLTMVEFALAYFILYLTILSICAISTNGAIEGGGAYYMISRALGPEFGGSIGLLFFLANIFSCALYITGFVEGLVDNFESGGSLVSSGDGIPGGTKWWNYLYCTAVLFFCLAVCMIGGAMFARTSVFILAVLVVCTLSVIVSMFFKDETCVPYPKSNNIIYPNASISYNHTKCANYTGFSIETFKNNLWADFSVDYITDTKMSFAAVFAVLFSSVTGIMNGANMSGELKDPSKAIPKGTLAAALFTLCTYLVLSLLTAFTSERDLLVNNYNYLQQINLWPPFVVIGIFAATLSAALGNLIGASRILEALAKDRIFWFLLQPATLTTRGGNPYVAVVISWALVQAVLLIGSLNAIAPMASELFLLSYASTNLACLALNLAAAPNFRPTFRFFSWHTSLLGLLGCLVMCFLINYIYAFGAIALLFALVVALHLRSFEQSWGSISQALIFHQVRKYLLLLDSRKDHIKYWRPQVLLLVANPRGSCELINFVNDLKKGGLYVLGHVNIGDLNDLENDPCRERYKWWLSLVDKLKIKAFVEVTLAHSIREGMQHLIRVSGLGGMKPNTICLGFYDNELPEDSFAKLRLRQQRKIRFYTAEESEDLVYNRFEPLRAIGVEKSLSAMEYLCMVQDALKMRKNVCLCRHFNQLNKESVLRSKQHMFIDVWPLNFFRPETSNYLDNTCLFMLQLACILHMVPGWKKRTILRIFMCADAQNTHTQKKEKKLAGFLRQLRILGQIKTVTWDHLTCLIPESVSEADIDDVAKHRRHGIGLSGDYIRGVNDLVKQQSHNTAVTFLYLPKPASDLDLGMQYLEKLETMTNDLPPTVLVNGIHPVTSTTL